MHEVVEIPLLPAFQQKGQNPLQRQKRNKTRKLKKRRYAYSPTTSITGAARMENSITIAWRKTIAELEPDVIALQEVDNKTQRVDGVDIAAELGKRLKMNHVFGNALYYSGGQYGEAILSRFPLSAAKAHHLPYRFGNEPRTALEVRVKPDNGVPEFIFVGTHLCHQSEDTRLEQTKELNKLFTVKNKLPIIVAGDLNARPDSKPMKVLLGKDWIDAVAPKSKIDYILLRKNDPWKIVKTMIVDEPVVSDHDPVLTILKWSDKK